MALLVASIRSGKIVGSIGSNDSVQEKEQEQVVNKKKKVFTIFNDIPNEDLEYISKAYSKGQLHEELKFIDSGSYGDVYMFKSLSGKCYAVKVMNHCERSKESRSQDVRNLIMLDGCIGIPKLYAYIENEIMIMDFVEGVNISRYPYTNKGIVVHVDFMVRLMEILEEVKNKNLFPCDIHDDNIMINKDGFPVIVDVGHFSTSMNKYDNPMSVNNLDFNIKKCKNFYRFNYKVNQEKEA